ncbi:alpha/beta fold hydrolase [Deinococcus sp. SDU3-2]|uniref:Alpha/beta fold hydrolase n=1 Tax=Deinococcus terrestris TaxID=2651870 RepID=A0A7X1TRN3_9DEIO|nr:alpha/beta fold hydrolase [Deinococcus terrestris]MPY66973.1 alpha/beta fold hydrolase [Deinococcus terrestris]
MPTALSIPTPAGHALAASLYMPAQPPVGAVLLAPATGIERRFYHAFAEYLAGEGYGVLSFDVQGIGESRTGHLRDCPASLVSWGANDLPAALDELTRQVPGARYHLIGHSAGGQLAGLMPNGERLSSLLAVAGSSGRIANMPLSYRAQAEAFMRVIIPASNRAVGYSRTDLVGMGGPLPREVGAQWARWCLGRGYVETGFGREVGEHFYGALDIPSLWLNAADDDIAVTANVDDMIRVFTKMALHAEKRTLVPAEHGLSRIGHMGFFRRESRTLWPIAAEWLERHAGGNS